MTIARAQKTTKQSLDQSEKIKWIRDWEFRKFVKPYGGQLRKQENEKYEKTKTNYEYYINTCYRIAAIAIGGYIRPHYFYYYTILPSLLGRGVATIWVEPRPYPFRYYFDR